MLLTIVLVLTLLVGAFLVVNLGMMSRREQDEQYKTTPEPSDLGILKGERFNRIVNERPEATGRTGAWRSRQRDEKGMKSENADQAA